MLPNQAQLAVNEPYDWTYSVQGLSSGCDCTQTAEIIKSALKISDAATGLELRSLAHCSYRDDKMGTISFTNPPPGLLGSRSSLPSRFERTFNLLDRYAGYKGVTEDADLQNLKITIDDHFEEFMASNSFDGPRKQKIE